MEAANENIVNSEMLAVLPLLLTASAVLIALLYRQWAVNKRMKGPRHWPLLGATVEVMSTFEKHHDWITGYSGRFGTFEMRVGIFACRRLVYTIDPANIEHMLKTNFSNYHKGLLTYEVQHELFGEGIFNSDGQRWRQQRKTASFEFSSRVLRDHSTEVFQKHALKLASLLSNITTSQLTSTIDMNELFMRLAFDSTMEVIFGINVGSLSPSLPTIPFVQAFDNVNTITMKRFFNPLWKLQKFLNIGDEAILKRDMDVLDNFITNLIKKRRHMLKSYEIPSENGTRDLISRFLTVSRENAIEYSSKGLKDVVLNFFTAGRETTATALSWLFFSLSRHPLLLSRLLRDIDAAISPAACGLPHSMLSPSSLCSHCLQAFSRLLTYESLSSMHFLHAAIFETLRLYPPVPENGKEAMQDDVLPDGTKLHAGDSLIYSTYAMGRMQSLWGADALTFNPDRWLQDGVFVHESPFKFTAFQAGPRICLGRDFALTQLKMTTALLLKFFKFELASDKSGKYAMKLNLSMAQGLEMYVSPREAS